MNNLLSITPNATTQIKRIMSNAPEGMDSVVIGVDKSGCSGYSYKLDFGNLVTFKKGACGVSSPTRGLFAGGIVPGVIRVIDLVEIATAGNATDFGDLTNDVFFCGGVSSPTRGVYGGGSEPSQTNIIQFVTIASAGDATDFGDLLDQRNPDNSQICSHTRGLFVGGENPGPSACKLVDKITIATTGNATNFGDIRTSTSQSAGCSDSHGGLSE